MSQRVIWIDRVQIQVYTLRRFYGPHCIVIRSRLVSPAVHIISWDRKKNKTSNSNSSSTNKRHRSIAKLRLPHGVYTLERILLVDLQKSQGIEVTPEGVTDYTTYAQPLGSQTEPRAPWVLHRSVNQSIRLQYHCDNRTWLYKFKNTSARNNQF